MDGGHNGREHGDKTGHGDKDGEGVFPYLGGGTHERGSSHQAPSIATITDQSAPPADDGEPRVNHPDPTKPPPPPPTPAQIFAGTDPPLDTTGLTAAEIAAAQARLGARAQVRINGFMLEAMGEKAKSASTEVMDRAASVFRADLREYWTFNRTCIESVLQLDARADAKLRALARTLSGDQPLMDAIAAWTDAWAADTTDWQELDDRSDALLDALTAFRTVLTTAYFDDMQVEVNIVRTLDSIAHEVAREASVRLLDGVVDNGNRFTGVTYTLGLASPIEALVSSMKLALASDVLRRERPSKYLRQAFVEARDTTHAGKGTPWINPSGNKPTQWAVDLMSAADSWAVLSQAWKPGSDAGALGLETITLGARIAAAKAVIVVAPDIGARRAAERAVDALAIAVADRIDELAANSVAIAARMGKIAPQLRAGVTIQVATDPISDFWREQKKAALDLLSPRERSAMDDTWLTGGLADTLETWLVLRKKYANLTPKESADFLSQTWTISDALTRYKVAASSLSNKAASQILLDAIDALARQVHAQMVTLRV